jgi:hypothetical protein
MEAACGRARLCTAGGEQAGREVKRRSLLGSPVGVCRPTAHAVDWLGRAFCRIIHDTTVTALASSLHAQPTPDGSVGPPSSVKPSPGRTSGVCSRAMWVAPGSDAVHYHAWWAARSEQPSAGQAVGAVATSSTIAPLLKARPSDRPPVVY